MTDTPSPMAEDELDRTPIDPHRMIEWIDECWPAGSGSDFNQGVVRGFEIIRAQLEHGHLQRECAALRSRPDVREALEEARGCLAGYDHVGSSAAFLRECRQARDKCAAALASLDNPEPSPSAAVLQAARKVAEGSGNAVHHAWDIQKLRDALAAYDANPSAEVNALVEAAKPICAQLLDEEYDDDGADDESVGWIDGKPVPRTFGQIRAFRDALANMGQADGE